MFLEGSNWKGRTDRQREVVSKRWGTTVKSCCTCLGLDPRDWHTIIIVWSKWTGWKWCGRHGVEINRLFFMQGFAGQQSDLEQYSKLYWQQMKGVKQWKTVSKWRRLCHQEGQLIMNMLKPYEVNVSDTIQQWIAIIKMLINTIIMLLSGVVLRVKSRGPKTDSWRTPKGRSGLEDEQSPSLICWHLPDRYDLNQLRAFHVTLNQSSRLIKYKQDHSRTGQVLVRIAQYV